MTTRQAIKYYSALDRYWRAKIAARQAAAGKTGKGPGRAAVASSDPAPANPSVPVLGSNLEPSALAGAKTLREGVRLLMDSNIIDVSFGEIEEALRLPDLPERTLKLLIELLAGYKRLLDFHHLSNAGVYSGHNGRTVLKIRTALEDLGNREVAR